MVKRWKYIKLNFTIENINFAAGSKISITMSKTKHTANNIMVLLTEIEQFVHIYLL